MAGLTVNGLGRTLRVTPLLVRPLPVTPEGRAWHAIRNDPYLPKADGVVRTNSALYYRQRKSDTPESVDSISLTNC